MSLVIHDFSRKFFCLQEKIFTEACLSIIHKTTRVNSLNILDKQTRQTDKAFYLSNSKKKT